MTQPKEASHQMNELGKARIPFLFIIDFQMLQTIIIPLNEIDPHELCYSINGFTNVPDKEMSPPGNIEFSFTSPDRKFYQNAFDKVMYHLKRGDSYLLNLTMPVNIETNLHLKQIFLLSKARYKLWLNDQFTVFSPEPFVRIINGKIFSYPMKGTIDAGKPNAMNKLLNDEKELAEHYTIVDLIRNDLNRIAKNVRVDKFRYVEEIKTIHGCLLQTSSLISGQLQDDYHENIGDLMFQLLPAGSISGAPKKKTLEIIHEAEQYERGYYTGVFGYFNGTNLDCGVMIRFIEKQGNQLVFKAGGGITVNSDMDVEYNELINKVYLPFRSYE